MKKYIFRQHVLWLVLIIFMIADPVLSSVLNFWLQKIIGATTQGQSKNFIIHLLTLGFLIWMGKRVVITLTSGIRSYIICNVRADLKSDVFAHLVRQFAFDVNDVSTGAWTSMFTNDITILETRYLQSILSLISNVLSLVILGGAFFALNHMLATCILGFGVLSLLIPVIFSRVLNRLSYAWSEQMGKFTQTIREYFSAFATIKNFSIEEKIQERFNRLNSKTERDKFDADFALATADNTSTMLAWFMQFIAISVGVILVTQGKIVLGTVIAAQSFSSDVAVPLIGIVNSINAMRSSSSIVKKIKESYLPTGSESEDREDKSRSISASGLCFDHVSLELSGREVVHDFSYRFEKGKRYLIIGQNGSGKSSLFRMLCQYYRQAKGEISINGRQTSTMDSKELSKLVSYMNENVSLFSDTLKNNITLYRSFTGDQLASAVNNAGVNMSMMERYLSDNNQTVSSGEKRRIEIARTLLSGAEVMIFDEVISTLDAEAAYVMEKQILSFTDKTVIQISHNFSRVLIEQYDDILIMDEGHLVAHGRFDDLLKENEYFQRLCWIKFGEDGNPASNTNNE